jgi:hypothetical protein
LLASAIPLKQREQATITIVLAAGALFVAVIGCGMVLDLADGVPPATDNANDMQMAEAIALSVF